MPYNDEQLALLAQAVSDKFFIAEQQILEKIAEKIKKQADSPKIKPTEVYQIQSLYNHGSDIKEIQKILSTATAKATEEIITLLNEVAEDGYNFSKPYFEAQDLAFIPLKDNKQLKTLITNLATITLETMSNFSNTSLIGLVVGDNVVPFAEAYKKIIDQAIASRVTGIDFYKNMRQTMNEISHNGMIQYASGTRRRIDTAVRYNLINTMHELNQGVQDQVGEEIGANGVEVSAHGRCAEDHQAIQGRQMSDEEYEKENGSLPRKIGKNFCRHYVFRIVLGVNDPIYTAEQLQKIKDESNKTVTVNGKEMSLLKARDLQNAAGLNVRRAKEALAVAEKTGDSDWIAQKKKVLQARQKVYNKISSDSGLPKSKWQTTPIK